MDLFNGFNILNTLLYSVIILFLYFQFYKLVYRYKFFKSINIDFNFLSTIIPFLVLGSILRILEQDYSAISLPINCTLNPLHLGFYFCTPGFLILISVFYLIMLFVSIILENKGLFNLRYYQYLNYFFYTFITILLFYLIINFTNLLLFLVILFLCLVSLLLINFILYLFKSKLLASRINKLVLFCELLDANSTFVGKVYLPNLFVEKHILSKLILGINPILFIILKISFTLLFLYLVDKYIVEKELNYYFKIFIVILSFLTGFRTLLTISLLR
jgi:uncharacterized membrane protein